MNFKAAISIINSPKPYIVELAIPNGQGRFILHKFAFQRKEDATVMLFNYFHEFDKNPDSILAYHNDIVEKHEANLELPFSV